MPLRYKKFILIFTLAVMFIGLGTFSLMAPDLNFSLSATKSDEQNIADAIKGTAGIVTMSDIMEQIVGRIDDEYVHDTDDDIEELPDGTYQINGTLAIDDLVELLGFEPEAANDVETAGGLLLSLFDRIPKEGDVAVLEDRGTKVTFTVLAMDRLRIDRICMAIDRPEEE